MKSIVIGPFMSQKTVSMAYFTKRCAWNILFTGKSVCLLWEPYPSHHNGFLSPILVPRDFAAREADQYRSASVQVPGSSSAGRVICGTDLAECDSVPGDFFRP